MDNNSSQFIESIITGVTSNVIGAIDPKLDQLNRTQEVFRENVEKILDKKIDSLDNKLNILGNIDSSFIIIGSYNTINIDNYKNNLFLRNKGNLENLFKKSGLHDKIINDIYKNLKLYKETNIISFFEKAKHLWIEEFMPDIDLFSKENKINIPEIDEKINDLSLMNCMDIYKQFINKEKIDTKVEALLMKIEPIRNNIKLLSIFLKESIKKQEDWRKK